MPEDQTEVSSFGIGVKIFRNEKGDFNYQHYMLNNGTPKEIMIMQLRRFIKELEREYFNQFKDKPLHNTPPYRKLYKVPCQRLYS